MALRQVKQAVLDVEAQSGQRQLSLRRSFNCLLGGGGAGAAPPAVPRDAQEALLPRRRLSDRRFLKILGLSAGHDGGGTGAGAGAAVATNDPRGVGAQVQARAADGKWWDATIEKVNPDGTFAVLVDDGQETRWPTMAEKYIRGRIKDWYIAVPESSGSYHTLPTWKNYKFTGRLATVKIVTRNLFEDAGMNIDRMVEQAYEDALEEKNNKLEEQGQNVIGASPLNDGTDTYELMDKEGKFHPLSVEQSNALQRELDVEAIRIFNDELKLDLALVEYDSSSLRGYIEDIPSNITEEQKVNTSERSHGEEKPVITPLPADISTKRVYTHENYPGFARWPTVAEKYIRGLPPPRKPPKSAAKIPGGARKR